MFGYEIRWVLGTILMDMVAIDLGMIMCVLEVCSQVCFFFFFSSRRRHTRFDCDWSSDVCSSDLEGESGVEQPRRKRSLAAEQSFLGHLPECELGGESRKRDDGRPTERPA